MAQQTSSCLSLFSIKHMFLLLLHNGNEGPLGPAFKLFKLLCHVSPQVPICFLRGHVDDGFTLQSMGSGQLRPANGQAPAKLWLKGLQHVKTL